MTKRKCVKTSTEEKIEIISYIKANPFVSDKRISESFSIKFKKDVSRRSINDIRKNQQSIIENSNLEHAKEWRSPILKYDSIDIALIQWIENLETSGAILNDNLIIEKSLEIARHLGHDQFKASKGWLTSFKKRHSLKLQFLHGESYDISPKPDNEVFVNFIKQKIEEYGPENTYNADETGLFYKLILSKSICKTKRNGYKLLKDRVSILFCVNMSGNDKLKPLVIGRYEKPRCFKGFLYESMVSYRNSSKAWMTTNIFSKWLLDWDLKLRRTMKKILLIVDNCAAHKVSLELKCIELIFLPPNSTSVLQPLDQGIIRCFKARFSYLKLKEIIERIECGQSTYNAYKHLNVRDAIVFTHFAWKDVSKETVINCFKHAKWHGEGSQVVVEEEIDNYADFLSKAEIIDPVDPGSFIELDYTEKDVLLEQAMSTPFNNSECTLLKPVEEEESSESNEKFAGSDTQPMKNIAEEKNISKKDCYHALQILKEYFNMPDMFDYDGINGINEISKALSKTPNRGTLKDWIVKK